MTPAQMREYDLFLDENDWDIYYWATQPPSPAAAAAPEEKKAEPVAPAKGEWAQTVGTFRPAFRPVPARWRDSEVLRLLRAHVGARSAAGTLGRGREGEAGEGMAFMPPLGARR